MFGHKSEPSKRYCYDIIENKSVKFIGKEFIFNQLKLANNYRNALIECRRSELDELNLLYSIVSVEYKNILTEISNLSKSIDEIYKIIKDKNKVERIRSQGTPQQQDKIKELKAIKKKKYEELKKEKKNCLVNLKDSGELDKLNKKYNDIKKDKYHESTELYFGCKTKIKDSIDKNRYPQFSSFYNKSQHSFSKQFQKYKGKSGLTWELALLGKQSVKINTTKSVVRKIQKQGIKITENLVDVPIFENGKLVKQGKKLYTTIKLFILDQIVEVSFIMDRPLPEGCVIKWIDLVCKKRANGYDKEIQFTVSKKEGFTKSSKQSKMLYKLERLKKENKNTSKLQTKIDILKITSKAKSGYVGIDTNWTKIDNGFLVAYWIDENNTEGKLILSKQNVDYYLKIRDMKSIRQKEFDEIMPKLTEWLFINQAMKGIVPEWLEKDTETIYQWKSPNRLSSLVRKWYNNRFNGDDIFDQLKTWLSQDQHLYAWEIDQSMKFNKRREHLYKNFWVEMSRTYETNCIEKLNVSKMKHKPNVEEKDNKALSKYRDVIAPGRFLEIGKEVMSKTITVNPKNTSKKCHVCKNICDLKGEKQEHICEKCGSVWNRHANASKNILDEGIEIDKSLWQAA